MTWKAYCQFLRDLIQKNELERVLEELNKLLKNSPKLDEAILQSARWKDLKKQIRLGHLSYEQSEWSTNRIRAGLLEFIMEIEKTQADREIEQELVLYANQLPAKNLVSNSTLQAGGDIRIGDQIQHLAESKTSRNVRIFLFVLMPLFVIAFAWLYHQYQRLQYPLNVTVLLDNQTPNRELDKDFSGGQLILQYSGISDTQFIKNEATFKKIPPNKRGEKARMKFSSAGFNSIDTTLILGEETITLPIRRDDTYAQIRGIVMDETGQPIIDATVSTRNISRQTDEQGRFILDIPFEQQSRQQRLVVAKSGYETWDRSEPVFQNELTRIQLVKQ